MANGSIVSPRNSATCPRASPEGTWKNSEPASEIATAESPAVLKKCIWISRDRPDSPAPSASEARRAVRLTASRPPADAPAGGPGAGAQAAAERARPGGPGAAASAPDPVALSDAVSASGPRSVMLPSCPMRLTRRRPAPRPDRDRRDLS